MDDFKDGNSVEDFVWYDEEIEKERLSPLSNVLEDLSSELKEKCRTPKKLFNWWCCMCRAGPMSADDADILDPNEDWEKCPGQVSNGDCSHTKCRNCDVEEVVEDADGTVQWRGERSKVSRPQGSNGMSKSMSLSEQILFKGIPMPEEFEFGQCRQPPTPGLTNSSAASPDANCDADIEPQDTFNDLEEVVAERKRELSFGLSKLVFERRKQKGICDNLMDTPGFRGCTEADFVASLTVATLMLEDPQDFIFIWQRVILPFLQEFVPEWCGPMYTIGVRRGKPGDKALRYINVMIDGPWIKEQEKTIKQHVLDLLPSAFHETTAFRFESGTIERLASSVSTTE